MLHDQNIPFFWNNGDTYIGEVTHKTHINVGQNILRCGQEGPQ